MLKIDDMGPPPPKIIVVLDIFGPGYSELVEWGIFNAYRLTVRFSTPCFTFAPSKNCLPRPLLKGFSPTGMLGFYLVVASLIN